MIITKRQFCVTLVIFLTLLLLFMGFQIGREAVSAPDLNKHIPEITGGKGVSALPGFIKLNKNGKPDGLSKNDEWLLYVGKENSEYAASVKEWTYYSRLSAAFSKKLPTKYSGKLPDLVFIEGEAVKGLSESISKLMDKGVDFVFLSLPDYDYIKSDDLLREILGIRKTYENNITLAGVHLFRDFLLGGERIFKEEIKEGQEADESERLQDLDLDIPWYSVRKRTKTYMRGILSDEDQKSADDKKLKNEDMPAVIWRSHYGSSEVYAVNGPYMKNRRAGMGILQAVMYERADYALYPVINAQVFSVRNFPIMTDENQAEVESVYGRPVTKTQTDIIMPMFITLFTKYEKKPTCFMSVKCRKNDPASPKRDILKKYLSMIDEMSGELSATVSSIETAEMSGELKLALDYINEEAPNYRIAAVMCGSKGLSGAAEALKSSNARDIRTVSVFDYSPKYPVVGYLDEEVTFQQSVSDLKRHTFTNELELLGIQTLLAYGNGCCDMANAFYPETKKDEWQNSSRDFFSNLTTYNAPFAAEDCLTASECDARVRTYFGTRYASERSGNEITLTRESGSENGGFYLLRTHNEKIASVSGGNYRELEEYAYLISPESESVRITLNSVLDGFVNMEGSNR